MADFMTRQSSVIDGTVVHVRALLAKYPEPIATAYLIQALALFPDRLMVLATTALIQLAKQPVPEVTQ
jgi:hypothetical protein